MKIKVLLVSPYSEKKVGGIGTWTKSILDYNSKNNLVDLYFLNTAFKYKSNIVRTKFYRIIYGCLDTFLLVFLVTFKLIKKRPNVIHYTSSASFALFKDLILVYISKLLKVKFIIHWRFGRIPNMRERNNWEWKIMKRVLKNVHKSIVLDSSSFNVLINANINNVVLIPNPVSEELRIMAQSVDFENKVLNKGEVVFVGHIIPAKGVYELVKACSKINEVSKLILIGPVKEEIKAELKSVGESNKLVWVGEIKRSEVFSYLQKANLMCLPSYTEGFPNVVLESMSLGCPVVATKVGAIPEMLNNEAGFCIDLDEKQLVEKIKEIVCNSNLSLKMGIAGNNRVLSKFTLDKVFSQYLEIWK